MHHLISSLLFKKTYSFRVNLLSYLIIYLLYFSHIKLDLIDTCNFIIHI